MSEAYRVIIPCGNGPLAMTSPLFSLRSPLLLEKEEKKKKKKRGGGDKKKKKKKETKREDFLA